MPTIKTTDTKGSELTVAEANDTVERPPVSKTTNYALTAAHNREFHDLGGTVDTVTLPEPVTGLVATGWFIDLKNTLATNITIARNAAGNKIDGVAADYTLMAGAHVRFHMNVSFDGFYVDSFKGPTTTRGDLIYHAAAGLARLAVGTAGYVLRSDGTDPAWALPAPALFAYRHVNQAHNSSGNWLQVVCGTEVYDDLTAHSVSTGYITIPAGYTRVNVTAQISFDSDADGYRGIRLINGSGDYLNVRSLTSAISGAATVVQCTSGWLRSSDVSVIGFQGFQNGAASLNMLQDETWIKAEFR